MLARFGFGCPVPCKKKSERRIWVHALSVGEVRSSFPFVKEFKKRHPEWTVVFTATTKTGYDTAEELLLSETSIADHLAYFPFDIGFAVKRVADAIDPDVVVLTETDLWPGFLFEMHQRNIPVVLMNARLSLRSMKGYLWFRRAGLCFHQWLSHIMVQTQLDADRFKQLGMQASTLSICGNIKFDQEVSEPDQACLNNIRSLMDISDRSIILLAGSTHEGEEVLLLQAYQGLQEHFSELKVVIAPRDPLRSKKLASLFISHGIKAACLSELEPDDQAVPVVFIDSMGLLAQLYFMCDIAYVGGSMVQCGGHNPLEPAAFAKPVLFGPDMSDFLEISQMLLEAGGAVETGTEEELEVTLANLLSSPDRCTIMGNNAQGVFLQHKGAVNRILSTMEQIHSV